MYWARSRVLEFLNFVSGQLPRGITPSLGPDATGVGWIYEYALVDRSGSHDLAQLRSRSEEHTSELQSLMRISYAVFCLKKKKKTTKHTYLYTQICTIIRATTTHHTVTTT